MSKPSPVRHGDMREVGGVSGGMRQLTLDCHNALQALLKHDDLKVQLAAIRLILSYGWGKPRIMDAPEASDTTAISLDGELETILKTLMERHKNDDDGEDSQNESEQALLCTDAGIMGQDGTGCTTAT